MIRSSWAHNRLQLHALRALPDELHDMYFVWVFACFESDLRHYWRVAVRDTNPPTEQLLSSIVDRGPTCHPASDARRRPASPRIQESPDSRAT